MDVRDPVADAARVDAVLETGLIDAPSDPTFDRLTELAARMLDVPTCLMCLVLPDRQVFTSRYDAGTPGVRETPIEYSYCQHVVGSGDPLLVADAREDPLLAGNPAIDQYDAIAYLGFPLIDGHGHRLGTLCALDTKPRAWTEQDLRMLRAFTGILESELQLRCAERDTTEQESAMYFAAVVHELRTPLTSISGFASTLTGHWNALPDDQRLEFVSIIDQQSRRLARFVDDLLLQSQLDAGHLVARRASVTVSAAVEAARSQFPGFEVRFEGAPSLAAFADELHVEQMLTNLISNAAKYGEPPVVIEAAPDDDHVLLTVFDHGTGVPAEDRAHLFERFARAQRTAAVKGSGLGLWIVRQLADANGGTCRYVPAPHGGAGFQLRLARAPGGSS